MLPGISVTTVIGRNDGPLGPKVRDERLSAMLSDGSREAFVYLYQSEPSRDRRRRK